MLANKLEFTFEYKGYKCFVIFTPMGYRCGYVELLRSNEYYGKDLDKIPVVCHGGLTYSGKHLPGSLVSEKESWYIGFDCGHTFDGIDLEAYKMLYKDDFLLVGENERDLISSSIVTMSHVKSEYPVKTKEYVENELKYIVDQLTGQPDKI